MENGKKNGIRRKKGGWVNIVFPVLTLIALAGFIGSLLFPNRVLDTYIMNMEEEEGDTLVLLPLSYEKPLLYEVETIAGPMQGLQLGINKRGQDLSGLTLHYSVETGGNIVSDNRYDLSQGDELQYVFLPFENPDACTGELTVSLLLETAGEKDPERVPYLEANHSAVSGTRTILYDGIETDPLEKADEIVSLRGSHIYSHDTYPFLYDARILLCIFLAVSMTLSFRGRRSSS